LCYNRSSNPASSRRIDPGKLLASYKEKRLKLLYCGHCGDVVRLFPEKRSCRCGKSWGQYLEDGATTLQTYPGLSLGIANQDFEQALNAFVENPRYFSPLLAMRCWVNPLSEPDVKFISGEETDEKDEDSDPTTSTSE
jgi:hypothetical protein